MVTVGVNTVKKLILELKEFFLLILRIFNLNSNLYALFPSVRKDDDNESNQIELRKIIILLLFCFFNCLSENIKTKNLKDLDRAVFKGRKYFYFYIKNILSTNLFNFH